MSSSRSLVCELLNANHGYGEGQDQRLLENATLRIMAGDKVGIVGPNGAGKSTLLRLLLGEEEPSGGRDKYFPCDPKTTLFFSQHQADLLPLEVTALECALMANDRQLSIPDVEKIMTRFRFKDWRMHKKVGVMSGGEKARLAIVRMMLSKAATLIFDEPTNHLDIPMKETLEWGIREFPGTVIVVSHDRWFLSQTCKTIMAIEDSKVVKYDGDFRYYMEQSTELQIRIEKRYTVDDRRGIQSVPAGGEERRALERGQLRKNDHLDRRKEITQLYKEGNAYGSAERDRMRAVAARRWR